MAIHHSREIPSQVEGNEADIIESLTAADPAQSKYFFLLAKQRLFDINNWADISKGLSASFRLTDKYGKEKKGLPEKGDHIRIDIPGPGSSAGEGYDWVRIEMVKDEQLTDAEERSIIKVRPSEDPLKKEGVAHFFESEATSSFVVKRKGNVITAAVHGRNEKPNTESKKIGDKVRNAVVGVAATSGLANIQWKKLAKGLLNND